MFCSYCGNTISDEAKFCGFCGKDAVRITRLNPFDGSSEAKTELSETSEDHNFLNQEPLIQEPLYSEPLNQAPLNREPVNYAAFNNIETPSQSPSPSPDAATYFSGQSVGFENASIAVFKPNEPETQKEPVFDRKKEPERKYTLAHLMMCLASTAVFAVVAGVFAGLYFAGL